MSSEELAAWAGVVLSLGLSYVPGLSGWFGGLSPDQKRLLMLGLLALVSAAAFGLACSGLAEEFGLAVTCDREGGLGLDRLALEDQGAGGDQAACRRLGYARGLFGAIREDRFDGLAGVVKGFAFQGGLDDLTLDRGRLLRTKRSHLLTRCK